MSHVRRDVEGPGAEGCGGRVGGGGGGGGQAGPDAADGVAEERALCAGGRLGPNLLMVEQTDQPHLRSARVREVSAAAGVVLGGWVGLRVGGLTRRILVLVLALCRSPRLFHLFRNAVQAAWTLAQAKGWHTGPVSA
eukprot:scaffold4845_cov98-Isochrysis_galbana.AAC.3